MTNFVTVSLRYQSEQLLKENLLSHVTSASYITRAINHKWFTDFLTLRTSDALKMAKS